MPMEFLAGTGAGFRLCWTSYHSGMDLGLHPLPRCPFGHPQLVVRLEIEPDLRRSPEVLAEPKRRVGRDGTRAVDDATDPVRRHRQRAGEGVDAQPQGPHELLHQDLPGRDWVEQVGCAGHWLPSVTG